MLQTSVLETANNPKQAQIYTMWSQFRTQPYKRMSKLVATVSPVPKVKTAFTQ